MIVKGGHQYQHRDSHIMRNLECDWGEQISMKELWDHKLSVHLKTTMATPSILKFDIRRWFYFDDPQY